MQCSMGGSNNVSSGPTLTNPPLSVTRDRWNMVGLSCGLRAQQTDRVQSQQLSQPYSGLRVFGEFSFPFQRLFGHTLRLSRGPRALLKDLTRYNRTAFIERHGERTGQPVFQHANAPNGALVAIVEVLEKVRLSRQRQMTLEGEDH